MNQIRLAPKVLLNNGYQMPVLGLGTYMVSFNAEINLLLDTFLDTFLFNEELSELSL